MRTSSRFAVAIIASLSIMACTQSESITEPGLQIAAARPVSGPVYVAQEVGFLPGDVRSTAYGVNDLGYVVGMSLPPNSANPWHPRAFLRAGSNMVELSARGFGKAVSGGSIVYVAGESFLEENIPTRWTYDPATGSVTEEILATSGRVSDVNDAGTVIGASAGRVTLWEVGGNTISIPPVSGFTSCRGKGINNAGHYTMSCSGNSMTAFLIANGNTIELIPAPGHTMSFAGAVSERIGNLGGGTRHRRFERRAGIYVDAGWNIGDSLQSGPSRKWVYKLVRSIRSEWPGNSSGDEDRQYGQATKAYRWELP